MGGAIAKRGFSATDAEVALLTSGQSLGLILSFLTAHMALRSRMMPLVFWPELARSLALVLVGLVKPSFALGFVLCHAAAQMFQAATIPARVSIYRTNYPSTLRGRIVGRNRQIQFLLAAILSLLISVLLEWGVGNAEIVAWLGPGPFSPGGIVSVLVPTVGVLGLAGAIVFKAVPVRENAKARQGGWNGLSETARAFLRVWREDKAFRSYENFFFVFGFANIMTIPLTQIHAVDALGANYLDLALINVALVQGLMALTIGVWGRLLDRYPPVVLRGILNLIFSVDLLILAVAPSIEWVYVGKIFRGVALGGGTLVWMLGSLYYAQKPEDVPIYLGLHTFLTGVRWALAPFAGIFLKQACGGHARPIFLASFIVIVATAIAMIRSGWSAPPRTPMDSPMPAPRTPGA
jgi:hypothetical protein